MSHLWRDIRRSVGANFFPIASLLLLSAVYFFVLHIFGIDKNTFAKEQQLLFLQGSLGSFFNNHFFAGTPTLFSILSKGDFLFEHFICLPFIVMWIGASGVYALLHYGKNVGTWIAVVTAAIWLVFPFWQYLDASGYFEQLLFFATIPWVILATIYLKNRYTIWAFAWFSLSLSALFKFCQPQTFYLAVFAILAALVALFLQYFRSRQKLSYAKFCVLVFAGFLLAIFASAQPVFSFVRLFGELTYANDYILPAENFFRLFRLETNIFLALAVLIFASFGAAKNYCYIFLAIILAGFPYLLQFLPQAWLVKNPYLAFGFVTTFLFVLFGVGLDRVLMMRKISCVEPGKSYLVFLLLSVILFVGLFLRFGDVSFVRFFIVAQIFSLLAFFLLLSCRRSCKNHTLLLSAIFAFVFSIFSVAGAYHRVQYSHEKTTPYKALDKFMSADKENYRIFPLESLLFDNRFGEDYATIGGSAPVIAKNYRELAQNCLEFELSSDLPINWNVLDMLAVKYVLRQKAPIKVDELDYVDYEPQTKISVYENKNYRGKLWFVDDALVLQNPESAYKMINTAGFDPFSLALLEEPLPTDVETPESYSAKIVRDDKDKIELRIFTDVPSFVVFSNNFSDDWYGFSKEDGVKIYKVNGFLQGFYLKPGLHEITLEYIPVLEKMAGKISLIFGSAQLVLLLVGFFYYVKKNYANKIVYILR